MTNFEADDSDYEDEDEDGEECQCGICSPNPWDTPICHNLRRHNPGVYTDMYGDEAYDQYVDDKLDMEFERDQEADG